MKKRLGKTCGNNGGKTRAGKACRRATQLDKDGLCKDHGSEKQALIKADKKRALELLKDPLNTVLEVADELGVTAWTLFDWRRTDDDFAVEWDGIRDDVDDVRTDIVEGNMFRRAASNRANPAESIFWLKNRKSERWKDKQERELTGKDGAPLIPLQAVRDALADVPPDELMED